MYMDEYHVCITCIPHVADNKKETKNPRKGNIIDFVLVPLVHMHITSYQYFNGLFYIILPPPPAALRHIQLLPR